MKVRDCLAMVVLFLMVSVLAGSVRGQADALPGPKYQNLRYDENFSYLGGEAGTYKDDMWTGEFIDRTGDDDNPSLVYAQIEYKY